MPTTKKSSSAQKIDKTANTTHKATNSKNKPAPKNSRSQANKPQAKAEGKIQSQDQDQRESPDLSLQFKGGKDKVLSPGQKKFNKQIKQLEALQEKAKDMTRELDQMMDFFVKEILPYKLEEDRLKVLYVKALFSFYKRKRKELTPNEHQTLGRLIKEEFERIEEGIIDKDPDLHIIWKKLYKQSYKDAVAEDLEACKIEAIQELLQMGVDFDPGDIFKIKDFETLNAKVLELVQKFMSSMDEASFKKTGKGYDFKENNPFAGQEEAQEDDSEYDFETEDDARSKKTPNRQKSAAQLKKELRAKEKEALKQKSIGSIYKQLAKMFHPDLEQDEDKKIEKDALMKQLTHAYQKKDLHTLLRLELGWIHKEENNIQQMTDDKLSIYNEILKEQIEELRKEVRQIRAHPKYHPVLSFSHYVEPKLSSLKMEFESMKGYLKYVQTKIDVYNMNNPASIALLKDSIEDFGDERGFGDDMMDDFLSILMAGPLGNKKGRGDDFPLFG